MSPFPKLDELDGAAKRAGLRVGLTVSGLAKRNRHGDVVGRKMAALTLTRLETPQVVVHSASLQAGIETAAERLLCVMAS